MSGRTAEATTLRDYWRVVRRRRVWVIGVTLGTVVFALGWSLRQDKVYTGNAVLLVQEEPADNVFGTGNGTVDDENQMDTALRVLEGDPVAERVHETLDLDAAPPRVGGSISEDSNVLEVSIEASDPESAAKLANTYAQALIDERRSQAAADLLEVAEGLDSQIAVVDAEIERLDDQLDEAAQTAGTAVTPDGGVLEAERERLLSQRSAMVQRSSELRAASTIQTGGARILHTAAEPTSPTDPKPVNAAIIGLFAGLLLGLAAAFLRDYFDDSVTSPEDLDKLDEDLPTLGVVPVIPSVRGRPVGIAPPAVTSVCSRSSARSPMRARRRSPPTWRSSWHRQDGRSSSWTPTFGRLVSTRSLRSPPRLASPTC
jgi:uncharacterized protein involved in exopolysaccharide biosynthesis